MAIKSKCHAGRAGGMAASRCGQRAGSDTGVVVKQASAGRHRLCQAVASNAAAASATSGCGAEIGMEWGAVQAASKEAYVCGRAAWHIAIHRAPPCGAWLSRKQGWPQAITACGQSCYWGVIKCGVFALSVAKSNGNCGTAKTFRAHDNRCAVNVGLHLIQPNLRSYPPLVHRLICKSSSNGSLTNNL